MKARKIKEGVYWVGVVDWDRRLFDSLIPLPDGTSYNSYLIQGSEKTVLVDTVDPAMAETFFSKLEGIKNIDYLIANHGEQDHSGLIPQVLEKYKNAKVVTSSKGKEILMNLLPIPEEKFIIVNDWETISLGNKTLEFIHTPWVHWPETMVTYLKEDRILFSCDFFGSHLATSDLYASDEARVYEAAKRYYAEIMMPFRKTIQKNVEKLKDREIEIIAPSHGPLYERPGFIIDAYRDWISDVPKNVAVIPYISMHGSIRKMVEYLVGALAERDVKVHQFDLAVTDLGKLAETLVDAATIVIGTPTIHGGAHPNVIYATYVANVIKPKAKFASIISSYSWGGRVVEQITGMLPNLKVEVLPSVVCKGLPKEADLKALDNLADAIAEKHKGLNLG